MAATFPVKIISPDRVLFSGEAEMVACRTEIGEIAFLAGHVPFVGSLDACKVRVILADGSGEEVFAVKSGFVQVRSNTLTVLSDLALGASEVDAPYLQSAKDDSGESERDIRWVSVLEELAGA